MKNYLFLFFLLLGSSASFAQSNWSIGLRTGAEMAKTNTFTNESTSLQLHEQLFITKKILKRFELELNGTYKTPLKNASLATPGQINDGPDYWMETSTTYIMEFSFSGRYFVYQKNGWEPYLTLGISSTKWSNNSESYESAYSGWAGNYPARYYENKYSEFNLFSYASFGLGINKSITNHWKLNTQLTTIYDAGSPLTSNYILDGFSPKLQIGLAYCW